MVMVRKFGFEFQFFHVYLSRAILTSLTRMVEYATAGAGTGLAYDEDDPMTSTSAIFK